MELFTPHYALKNMGLGSGIRKKPIPDPGSRCQKAPDPGSVSATLTHHCDAFHQRQIFFSSSDDFLQ